MAISEKAEDEVLLALKTLDGTRASRVALLAGISREDIEAVGGVTEDAFDSNTQMEYHEIVEQLAVAILDGPIGEEFDWLGTGWSYPKRAEQLQITRRWAESLLPAIRSICESNSGRIPHPDEEAGSETCE